MGSMKSSYWLLEGPRCREPWGGWARVGAGGLQGQPFPSFGEQGSTSYGDCKGSAPTGCLAAPGAVCCLHRLSPGGTPGTRGRVLARHPGEFDSWTDSNQG